MGCVNAASAVIQTNPEAIMQVNVVVPVAYESGAPGRKHDDPVRLWRRPWTTKTCRLWSCSLFGRFSLGNSGLNNSVNQAARSLDEGEFAGETAFQQDTNSMVACDIGSCHQGDVLSDPKMR